MTISIVEAHRRFQRGEPHIPAFAVAFERHGRRYQTLFTQSLGEAESWRASVAATGWTVSGRPLPQE